MSEGRRILPARISRRGLLAGLGAAGLAPWIPILNASGEEPTVPRRVVLFFTPHGTVWEHFRPTGEGTDFQLSRILSALEPQKKKIVVVEGLGVRDDGPGAPHTKGPPLLFTASPLRDDGHFNREDCSGGCTFGWNSGPSFDQVLAPRFEGVTPYKSLEFGVHTGGGFPGSHIIYSGDSTPVPPRQDPVKAFDDLFGNLVRPEEEGARLARHRREVLRVVNGELSRLEPKVATADRPKVQAHRAALADLETQLFRPVPVCTIPGRPDPAERPQDSADSMEWILERQTELLVAALRCDLTRVASLQFRPGENDGYPYRFLGIADEHHLATHEQAPEKQEQITKIYEYYARSFGYLLELLDGVPEGDGTMLDHTLVIWGSEVGVGWSHTFDEVPFVVAGGGAFGVQTGRVLRCAEGTYHNRLLVSAMRFMGMTDIDKFGSTDQESGPLPGLGV
jgi:hypothetical protein